MTTESAFVIELPEGHLAIHDLTVGAAAPDAPEVLAVHGITANGLSWQRVADEVHHRHGPGAVRFLAPDREVVDGEVPLGQLDDERRLGGHEEPAFRMSRPPSPESPDGAK